MNEMKKEETKHLKIQMTWKQLQNVIEAVKKHDEIVRDLQGGSNTVGVVLYVAFRLNEQGEIDPTGDELDFLPVHIHNIEENGEAEVFNRYIDTFETVNLKKRCKESFKQLYEEKIETKGDEDKEERDR